MSFYNETNGVGVFPTPVIGMLGIVQEESLVTPSAFQVRGDVLLLVGPDSVSLAGSEYLELFHSRIQGSPLKVDLAVERRVQRFLRTCIREGWITSAHDCSEGGLLVASLEAAAQGDASLGFRLHCSGAVPLHRELFGEGPSRVLISVNRDRLDGILMEARNESVSVKAVGEVTSGPVQVFCDGSEILSLDTREILATWDGAMDRWMSSGGR